MSRIPRRELFDLYVPFAEGHPGELSRFLHLWPWSDQGDHLATDKAPFTFGQTDLPCPRTRWAAVVFPRKGVRLEGLAEFLCHFLERYLMVLFRRVLWAHSHNVHLFERFWAEL